MFYNRIAVDKYNPECSGVLIESSHVKFNLILPGREHQSRATFLWSLSSLGFDWALFRTINVDQHGGKTESERFQRLLAMMI